MSSADSINSPRAGLTAFEKRLCNALQNGLPIVRRPFARIARALQSVVRLCSPRDEKTVIETTRGLLKKGVIRRLGAVINWRAIGQAGTLVTAHIENGDLQNAQHALRQVVKAVNALEGVSHNYLRQHHFNLWFTLRADSEKEIETILGNLSKRFGVRFYSLPATRIFKLDVRFDAESGGRRLIVEKTKGRRRTMDDGRWAPDEIDNRILTDLQKGLDVVEQPFDVLGKDDFEIADALLHIEEMINEGIISRLGAVVSHYKLGFTANAMFVCKAEASRVEQVGKRLAKLNIVSHCYERKPVRQSHGRPFKGWPYNIFGMMHGRDLSEIRAAAEKFVKSAKIEKWDLLATAETLKK